MGFQCKKKKKKQGKKENRKNKILKKICYKKFP